MVEAEGRFPHLPHARPERCGVFRAVMGVEAEGHLELVHRFADQTVDEDLVQPAEAPVQALEPVHAGFHRKPRVLRSLERGKAREGGEVPMGLVGSRVG